MPLPDHVLISRVAAALRESEARLRELAERAFDFVVYSRDGVALEVSAGIERVLGFTPGDWVGKELSGILAPGSVAPSTAQVAEERSVAYEAVLSSSRQQPVPVQIISVMSTLNGEPVRVDGVRDLREQHGLREERRHLYEQLERSRQLESLAVLAGGVAHDFNNLLVGVLGNAELLLEALSQPADRELCEGIIGAAERATELTSRLMGYAGRVQVAHGVTRAVATPRPSSGQRPCEILVIDDESVVRSLLRRSLERRGYTVSEAAGGHEGIRVIRETVPDVVVLDMAMPDLDGAEVLRRVRAEGFTMPILLASGQVDPTREARLAAGTFQGFLRKPFSVAELMTALEAAGVSPPQTGS